MYNTLPRILFICVFFISCNNSKSRNLYWPGDFEQSLYGGCFSRAVKVNLTREQAFSGKRSWELIENQYQHLELLTQGEGQFGIKFKAKAENELDIIIKVVYKENEKSNTKNHTIKISGGMEWQDYAKVFIVHKPYPGPETGEVLISCYNGSGGKAWLDDLNLFTIRKNPKPSSKFNPVDLIKNSGFQKGSNNWNYGKKDLPDTMVKEGKLILKANPTHSISVSQIIDATELSGKTIRLSADIGFQTIRDSGKNWSGVVLTLRKGTDKNGSLLPSDPCPHWLVLGLANRPGQLKRTSAIYKIPETCTNLFLEIQSQKGLKDNIPIIDNFRLEILDND